MSRLLEFPLQDGNGSVLVQVQPVTVGPVTRGFGSQAVVERAQRSFEETLSRIQPAAQALIDCLRKLADTPDEVGVEFGLQLTAEAGAFIASGSTTANFKVSLTWRRGHLSAPSSSALANAAGSDGGR